MKTIIRNYKNHEIKKIIKGSKDSVRGYHLEYYLVDNKERFWYLKDAKAFVDSL